MSNKLLVLAMAPFCCGWCLYKGDTDDSLLMLLNDNEEEFGSAVCGGMTGDNGGGSVSNGWLPTMPGRPMDGECCSRESETSLVSMDNFSATKTVDVACVTVLVSAEICMIGSSIPDKGGGVACSSVVDEGAGVNCSSVVGGGAGIVSIASWSIDVD